jgi:hypothetical protein
VAHLEKDPVFGGPLVEAPEVEPSQQAADAEADEHEAVSKALQEAELAQQMLAQAEAGEKQFVPRSTAAEDDSSSSSSSDEGESSSSSDSSEEPAIQKAN